jgi:hypothetical protein
VEKLRHLQWPAEKACQRLTAAIFEQEHGALVAAQKRKRPNRPRGIKLSPEGVFVLKSPECRRRAGFSDGGHHKDARLVCIVPACPVKGTISLLQNCLKQVSGQPRHGRVLRDGDVTPSGPSNE